VTGGEGAKFQTVLKVAGMPAPGLFQSEIGGEGEGGNAELVGDDIDQRGRGPLSWSQQPSGMTHVSQENGTTKPIVVAPAAEGQIPILLRQGVVADQLVWACRRLE
jgi:hypothetical protein